MYEISIRKFKRSNKTFENYFTGTVGGQMGMFIGASILSIIELVEFLCLLLTKGSKRWVERSTRKPRPDVCVNAGFDEELGRNNLGTETV